MLKARIPELSYWFDLDEIIVSDDFEEKIIEGIDCSNYVLFAVSDNSVGSKWAKKEVVYAKNTNTKIFPVILDGVKLKKGWFLFEFGTIDCIDSADKVQVEKFVNNLASLTSKEVSGDVVPTDVSVMQSEISAFKFYSNEDCDIYKDGKLISRIERMAELPYYLPVTRRGDYRFKCVFGDGKNVIINQHIDGGEERIIHIKYRKINYKSIGIYVVCLVTLLINLVILLLNTSVSTPAISESTIRNTYYTEKARSDTNQMKELIIEDIKEE